MILVTGVSGFIGKHLLAALVKEYGKDHVLALTSEPTSVCPYLIHHNYTFDADYILAAGHSSVDTIIHAGAFTPKNASESNDWKQSFSNINNTQKVLQLQLPELKKFVFLSTLDVYGKDEVITEQSPVEPVSLYGHSKLFCEKMIASWAQANNKVCQVLRVGHIYGPGEENYQKLIPITIRKMLAGQTLEIWGTGNEIRSFLYIDDLVCAILQSLKIKANIDVVNLVSGNSITVKALMDKLVDISDTNTSIKIVAANGQGRNLIFDNSTMKKWMNISETPLDKGLSLEWEYMKALKL